MTTSSPTPTVEQTTRAGHCGVAWCLDVTNHDDELEGQLHRGPAFGPLTVWGTTYTDGRGVVTVASHEHEYDAAGLRELAQHAEEAARWLDENAPRPTSRPSASTS